MNGSAGTRTPWRRRNGTERRAQTARAACFAACGPAARRPTPPARRPTPPAAIGAGIGAGGEASRAEDRAAGAATRAVRAWGASSIARPGDRWRLLRACDAEVVERATPAKLVTRPQPGWCAACESIHRCAAAAHRAALFRASSRIGCARRDPPAPHRRGARVRPGPVPGASLRALPTLRRLPGDPGSL